MGKFVFNLALLGLAWYLYSSGLLMAVLSGNVPEVGRTCQLWGPKNGQIYVALSRDDIKWPFDATIGFTQRDRAPAQRELSVAVDAGKIICPSDHTAAKILATDKLHLYSCLYPITKVKILSGAYKGKVGWVQRENVIDTPLQELIQRNFRPGMKHFNEEMAAAPSVADQDQMAPPRFFRRSIPTPYDE